MTIKTKNTCITPRLFQTGLECFLSQHQWKPVKPKESYNYQNSLHCKMKDTVVAQGSNDRATLCDKYRALEAKLMITLLVTMSRIVHKKMHAQF